MLRPVATVRGRVVNRRGKPVGDARAWIWQSVPEHTLFSPWSPDHAPYDLTIHADGTFQFSRVAIPDTSLMMLDVRKHEDSVDRSFRWTYKAEVTLYGLQPGKTLDLGDVVLKQR